MKIFNIIFSVLLLLSAALQYNDPDPYIWMTIYLYGGVLCFLASKKRFFPKAYLAGIIVYGIYAVYLFFDEMGVLTWANEHGAENIAQSMQAEKPWIEETREFFGLIILIFVLSVNWIYCRRYLKKERLNPTVQELL